MKLSNKTIDEMAVDFTNKYTRDTIRKYSTFIVKCPNVINSNSFENDIWRQELNGIASDPERVALFNKYVEYDFNTYRDIAFWMLNKGIINDEVF